MASRPVYSAQFLVGNYTAADNPFFLTPEGMVAVLHSVDVFVPAGDLGIAYYLQDFSTDGAFWTIQEESTGADASFQWRGRQAFPYGDGFRMFANSNYSCLASGYLLTDA